MHCPKCKSDLGNPSTSYNLQEGFKAPKPNDIVICNSCACIVTVTEKLEVVEATGEELMGLYIQNPIMFVNFSIAWAQIKLLSFNKQN